MPNQSETFVARDLEDAFEGGLTLQQVRAIFKLTRHCRRYCRSNAALVNFGNRVLPGFAFSQVDAIDDKTGEPYKRFVVQQK